MATTESDILIQGKKDNNLKILYPVTKTSNVLDKNEESLDNILKNIATKEYVTQQITGALEESY